VDPRGACPASHTRDTANGGAPRGSHIAGGRRLDERARERRAACGHPRLLLRMTRHEIAQVGAPRLHPGHATTPARGCLPPPAPGRHHGGGGATRGGTTPLVEGLRLDAGAPAHAAARAAPRSRAPSRIAPATTSITSSVVHRPSPIRTASHASPSLRPSARRTCDGGPPNHGSLANYAARSRFVRSSLRSDESPPVSPTLRNVAMSSR
jgi:hypothetical protein